MFKSGYAVLANISWYFQAQRELDDYVESNESMNREINNLKNKLR